MEYLEEAKKLLREILWEDWMDENDYNEIVIISEKLGFNAEKIATDIATGVKNGYSAESQIKIVQDLIKSKTL